MVAGLTVCRSEFLRLHGARQPGERSTEIRSRARARALARAQWQAHAGNRKQSRMPMEGRGIRRRHGCSAAVEMKGRWCQGREDVG